MRVFPGISSEMLGNCDGVIHSKRHYADHLVLSNALNREYRQRYTTVTRVQNRVICSKPQCSIVAVAVDRIRRYGAVRDGKWRPSRATDGGVASSLPLAYVAGIVHRWDLCRTSPSGFRLSLEVPYGRPASLNLSRPCPAGVD